MKNVEFYTSKNGGFAINHYKDSATLEEIYEDIKGINGWDYVYVYTDDDNEGMILRDGTIVED